MIGRARSVWFNVFIFQRRPTWTSNSSTCFETRHTPERPHAIGCATRKASWGPISHRDRESRIEAKITSPSARCNSQWDLDLVSRSGLLSFRNTKPARYCAGLIMMGSAPRRVLAGPLAARYHHNPVTPFPLRLMQGLIGMLLAFVARFVVPQGLKGPGKLHRVFLDLIRHAASPVFQVLREQPDEMRIQSWLTRFPSSNSRTHEPAARVHQVFPGG